MRRTVAAIADDTGLSVEHIMTTWRPADFLEWARVERIRAQADYDQSLARADHYERLADRLVADPDG